MNPMAISFMVRFAQNRGAMVGLLILALVVLLAVCAPLLYPESPWRMVQRPFLAPSEIAGFPLGTDTMGRDVAAGLAHGAWVSLLIGLISTAVALAIGVPLGALAGYFGGRVDDVLIANGQPGRIFRQLLGAWSTSVGIDIVNQDHSTQR